MTFSGDPRPAAPPAAPTAGSKQAERRIEATVARIVLADDRRALRYAVAVAIVGIAWAARELVLPQAGDRSPFVAFGLAVLASALVGGLGPGLLAMALSSLIALLLYLPPYLALEVHAPLDLALLGVFVVEGLIAAGAGALVRRSLVTRSTPPSTDDPLGQFLRRAGSLRAERTGPAHALVEELTPREREVAALLAVGATNDDIARTLLLSRNTVKTHLKNIYAKLGARTRTEAVARLIELGLLTELERPAEVGAVGLPDPSVAGSPAGGPPTPEVRRI